MKFKFPSLVLIIIALSSCSTTFKVTEFAQESKIVSNGHSGKHRSCSLCNPRHTEKVQLVLEPIPPIQIAQRLSPPSIAEKIKPREHTSPEKKTSTPIKEHANVKSKKNILEAQSSGLHINSREEKINFEEKQYKVTPNGWNKAAIWGFVLSLTSILIVWGFIPLAILIGWSSGMYVFLGIGLLLSIISLIFSIIGYLQIRRASKKNEPQKGKGLAIVGILLSIIHLSVLVLVIGYLIQLFFFL